MNVDQESNRRSFKPSFLMLAILGVHVVGVGSFMLMSGCRTQQPPPMIEPPPAPVMPPRVDETVAPPVAVPRPAFKPPIPVSKAPETVDAAGAKTYVVQKGDSLSKIAARAGVSVRELSELNNVKNQDQIRIGQKLLLPAHATQLPSAPAPAAEAKPAAKPASAGPAKASSDVHVVQAGDSLSKLAVRYGTTVAAFKSVNNLKSDNIRIGQKLTVPVGKKASAPAAEKPKTEAAKPAESAAPAAPAPAPAAPAPAAPAPEVAPAPEAAVAPAADESGEVPFPYTVKEGDTLDSIALKFSARKDVIMRLNNLTSEQVSPGQKLQIPWN